MAIYETKLSSCGDTGHALEHFLGDYEVCVSGVFLVFEQEPKLYIACLFG